MVGKIILQQLGGNAFISLTGSHNFKFTRNGLSMCLHKNISMANSLEIILNSTDTYDMTFFKSDGLSKKTVKEYNNIYWDQLRIVFQRETGLVTRL